MKVIYRYIHMYVYMCVCIRKVTVYFRNWIYAYKIHKLKDNDKVNNDDGRSHNRIMKLQCIIQITWLL